MLAITLSPKSRQDLIDIGDYIAKDSRTQARLFMGKLKQQCQRIGTAPLAYPGRENLALGLRMAPIGNYVIFFRVMEGVIRIERVLQGSRDLSAIFSQG